MIPRSGLMWIGLALAVGGGLFQLKHEVQSFEDELVRLNRALTAEQQAIHVLKAEWSLMNQPARLQGLAERHLELKPMDPKQIVTISEIPFPGDPIEPPPPPKKVAPVQRKVAPTPAPIPAPVASIPNNAALLATAGTVQ